MSVLHMYIVDMNMVTIKKKSKDCTLLKIVFISEKYWYL